LKIDIDNITLEIQKHVSSHDNIAVVYLFGSAATGKMRPSSDIDIAIMSTRRIDGFERIAMETELSGLLHMDVDLVVFHQAGVLLLKQILPRSYPPLNFTPKFFVPSCLCARTNDFGKNYWIDHCPY
jgi:predicted nucleotidyltransferase